MTPTLRCRTGKGIYHQGTKNTKGAKGEKYVSHLGVLGAPWCLGGEIPRSWPEFWLPVVASRAKFGYCTDTGGASEAGMRVRRSPVGGAGATVRRSKRDGEHTVPI